MFTIEITSTSDWDFFASFFTVSNPLNGTLNIIADLTFNYVPAQFYLSNTGNVNGQCHIITLTNSQAWQGLFVMPITGTATSEIKNLIIEASGESITDGSGTYSFLLYNSSGSFDFQRGKITNVHIKNGTVLNNGALMCTNFGDNTYTYQSYITECSVTTTLGDISNVGIGFCLNIYNSTFNKCFYNGVINNGNGFCSDTTTVQFKNCYSKSDIPDNSSGFINFNSTSLLIDNCYVIGNIIGTTTCAGFITSFGFSPSNTNINNSYHIGNILNPDPSIGSFIGLLINQTINISYCYSTSSSGSMIGTIVVGPVTITDSHLISTASFVNTGSITNVGSALDLVVNVLFTNWNTVPDINSTTNTWSTHVSDYPTLNTFTDTLVWDGTYTLTTSTPDYATSLCIISPFVPCFAENTPIQTSNGIKLIQNIKKGDILDGYEVETIVKSPINNQTMIKIEKDSIQSNLPSQDTFVTKQHLFQINGKQISAGNMTTLNPTKIYKVRPISNFVYHIILKNRQYAFITVNGLKAETLGIKFQEIMTKEINKLAITI